VSRARRGWLVAVLVTAVVALVGSVGVAAATLGRSGIGQFGGTGVAMMAGVGTGTGTTNGGLVQGMTSGRAGTSAGMMGGTGMMGERFGLAGDGQPVTTLTSARARAQAFADELGAGLRAGEVMEFSNGYYAEVLEANGSGATEVLVDQRTGAVSVEHGPAVMWNTRYGMHAAATGSAITTAQAVADAQAWLDAQRTGLTAGDAEAFPGYFTLHTLKDGAVVGMMSVHASTGAAWYHTWHGTFIAMDAG
jgi:hypothetical protein